MSVPEPLLPSDILYEDNHCLAVNKPARLLTVGDETGDVSLQERAQTYLKAKYQKPGNVFLGVVHRLDRPVSGIVLFARTSKAAGRLSTQFRERDVNKIYLAVVEGDVRVPEATLVDWLRKDRDENLVTVAKADSPGAKRCVLSYRLLERAGRRSLLEVQPETGRSHQIRVQLAQQGLPICGDKKYGSRVGLKGAIALHAAELTFEHPTQKHVIQVKAGQPVAWRSLLKPPPSA